MVTAHTKLALSAARTATETFTVESNNLLNAHIILDITAGAGAPTIVLTVDAYDPTSKKWYNLLTGAAIATNVTTVYRIGTNYTAVANLTVEDFLPRKFRVVATKNDATAMTYSIGMNQAG